MFTLRIKIPVSWLKRHFWPNLGVPFIVAFQVMLLVCAHLLVQENVALANDVAVYAFYSLAAGVGLQVVCFIRDRGKTSD
jgi:hypothetical protein